MKIELNRDWSEFLCALIARRVRFVLVGGHAVAGHGEPRLTEDLDVFVSPTLGNARRLREALGSADDERVVKEIAVFGIKIDVDEELQRLNTHLSEVERVVAKGGSAGKRLDFLMQELNREANTLGSKAASQAISDCALELKLLIEQMREQVQNIE